MRISKEIKSVGIPKNIIHFYTFGAILFGFLAIVGTNMYASLFTGYFASPIDYNSAFVQSIEIADNVDFEPSSTSLNADAVVNEVGITYASIKLDEILESEGQYIDSDQAYMAYTFYIKNKGVETLSIDYYMRITEVFDLMNEYVRILIIEDDDIYRMYQKVDQLDDENNEPNYIELPIGIDFLSESIIFRESFDDFKPGEVKTFRVIIWLEEQDPDIDKNNQSGHIETSLVFTVRETGRPSSSRSHTLSSEDKNIWIPYVQLCSVQLGIYYDLEEDAS